MNPLDHIITQVREKFPWLQFLFPKSDMVPYKWFPNPDITEPDRTPLSLIYNIRPHTIWTFDDMS